MAYVPDCDSNLILFGQLWDNGIKYIDDNKAITFVQSGQVIVKLKRDCNLIILDLTTPNRVMQITGHD